MTKNFQLDEIDPKKLANHPLNAQLYGTQPDAEFVSSVKRLGVLTPIEITQSGIIISGHRRRQAAIKAELPLVPVLVNTEELDDLEIRQRIIEANRNRPKTMEEIAREYEELARVEKELAKRRQATSTGGANPQAKPASEKISPTCDDAGRAKDKAAEKVGMSRPTAEKAATVVSEIDKAEAAGDTGRAAELRHELNDGTVAAAHRKATGRMDGQKREQATPPGQIVDETGQKVPQHLHVVFGWRSRFDAMLKLYKQVAAEARKAEAMPGSRLPFNVFKCDHDNARNTITFARPHAVCRPCKGQGKINGQDCKACKSTGWLTKDEFGQLAKPAADEPA